MKTREPSPTDVRRRLERLASILRWGPSGSGKSAGRDHGGRLGRAGEFEAYRPWRPGDDLRSMDVRVYRRLRRRVARIDREDSALPLTLLIDRSASMAPPARDRCVRELAIFFLALARARGEPRRVLFFVDRPPQAVPEVDASTIERALDRIGPTGTSDFDAAFSSLPIDPHGPGRVIVLTDGFGIENERSLATLPRHGRVLMLAPWTAEELRPSFTGLVTLRSSEEEDSWRGVVDRELVHRYREENTRRWIHLEQWLRGRGGDAHRVVAEAGALGAIEQCLVRGRWLRR